MAAFGLLAILVGAPTALMGTEAPSSAAFFKTNQNIHIKADEVIADLESGETQFLGNVRVSQGQSVITADRMLVYYRKSEGNSDPNNLAIKESIHKIIARGNVEINYENIIALSEEAVYMADSKILTLSGAGSEVISGTNRITGSKFVLSLANSGLSVEGGDGQRVQALIFPGKGDLF
jgi:lipopolysaccharide export system protein LptA